MYSTWSTFFGIPLSQCCELNSSLKALACVADDGWSLKDLSNELLNDYKSIQEECGLSDESLAVLGWLVSQKEALLNLDVELNCEYSGDGERPIWFGFSVDMPHSGALEATALLESHAKNSDIEKSHKLLSIFMQSPGAISDLFIQELGFYSMHGTS